MEVTITTGNARRLVTSYLDRNHKSVTKRQKEFLIFAFKKEMKKLETDDILITLLEELGI